MVTQLKVVRESPPSAVPAPPPVGAPPPVPPSPRTCGGATLATLRPEYARTDAGARNLGSTIAASGPLPDSLPISGTAGRGGSGECNWEDRPAAASRLAI